MVVLLCCVDHLTTSHISIWAPPHLSFPILANIFLAFSLKNSSFPNIQNAAWMDYDTTCILAREIRLNEIRALCFSVLKLTRSRHQKVHLEMGGNI